MLATRLPFRQFGMVAAKDYFFSQSTKKKWLSLLMHLLPLNRTPTREEIEQHIDLCHQFCQEKKGVLIFYPEGTRSLTGIPKKFKKGAALYACKMQIPIVPAYIEGTFRALPKGKNWPRPSTIKVCFGKPIQAVNGGLGALRKITADLESSVLQLKDING
jgi:1-acyl-sn-glycerol-3-phosphate acyltransferase